MSEPEKTLDVRGLYCPSPAMQTVVELSKMQVGQTLLVLADDPAAVSYTHLTLPTILLV